MWYYRLDREETLKWQNIMEESRAAGETDNWQRYIDSCRVLVLNPLELFLVTLVSTG